MKKVKYLLLVVAVLVLSCFNVKAMTEAELQAKLTKEYVFNGKSYQLSSKKVVEIERYFNQFDVSSADCDYISNKVDEAISIFKNAKVSRFSDLPAASKQEIHGKVAEIKANTSVNASVDDNGNLTVYYPDGSGVFTVLTPGDVRKTDGVNYILIVSCLVVMAGTCVVVRKLRTND